MENLTTVEIYGIPAGRRRERKIGTGTLGLARLVMPDDAFKRRLRSDQPPAVHRVGIGYRDGQQVEVEVIEVRQVLESDPSSGIRTFGLELADASQAPTTDPFDGPDDSAQSDGPQPAPATIWCMLFPQASFCN